MTDLEDAVVRNKLAVNARELGRPDLARMWYNAAIGLDPQNEEARRGLAEIEAEEAQDGQSPEPDSATPSEPNSPRSDQENSEKA